ncbi:MULTISPECIES: phage holin family protein [unclassified Pseudactinotalea]|uniref:phage holin family protein n=1 Tax=unclassified Pseudactinotalea TaxID=2649176 RepID=UPI00128E3D89|nr:MULTISPECIES: phage holin family protein [unclassified Pseudactinotalea]MPV50599.1 phage holin family protein [Pseudactinotalea sp. HY160]QGH70755.1 phage holin family protein [Pseudactinotalea sp. HY158]
MQFVLRVLANGVAIWLASELLAGVAVNSDETWQSTVLVIGIISLIFTLINSIVKPVVKIVTFPLYILTLGLFFVIVNAAMLLLTSWISSHTRFGLSIDNFGTAVLGALIISIVSAIIIAILPDRRRRRQR